LQPLEPLRSKHHFSQIPTGVDEPEAAAKSGGEPVLFHRRPHLISRRKNLFRAAYRTKRTHFLHHGQACPGHPYAPFGIEIMDGRHKGDHDELEKANYENGGAMRKTANETQCAYSIAVHKRAVMPSHLCHYAIRCVRACAASR
jgi:hypothetical protein